MPSSALEGRIIIHNNTEKKTEVQRLKHQAHSGFLRVRIGTQHLPGSKPLHHPALGKGVVDMVCWYKAASKSTLSKRQYQDLSAHFTVDL